MFVSYHIPGISGVLYENGIFRQSSFFNASPDVSYTQNYSITVEALEGRGPRCPRVPICN